MANPSCGAEATSEAFKEHRAECAADIPAGVAEGVAVSCPVLIQNAAPADGSQSAGARGPVSDAALIAILPEGKGTEEHGAAIRRDSRDRRDPEAPAVKLHGSSEEADTETKTSPSAESQTSSNSEHLSQEHFLRLDEQGVPFERPAETRTDAGARDDLPERPPDPASARLQTTDETETVEPPAKKRLRKRMGMCGLGDKKKKLVLDGQRSRWGLLAEGDPECNGVVQHRFNVELKSDNSTLMDTGGTTNDGWAEEEEERRRAPGQCVVTTDESLGEDGEEDNAAIIVADDGTNDQDELSVAAAASVDQDMGSAGCGEEPNVPGIKTVYSGQDVAFDTTHDVLSEKRMEHAGDKADGNPEEVPPEEQSSCPSTVETSKGSVVAAEQAIQAVSADLQDPEGGYPPGLSTREKQEPCGATRKPLAAGDGAGGALAPSSGQEKHMHCFLDPNACDTSVTRAVAEQQQGCNPAVTPGASGRPQEPDVSSSPWLCSMTDSQIHKIALSMELEDQPTPESSDQPEDVTELVRGLIREVSTLNRTVMAAHREMELVRRGKLPKASNRRHCGPRSSEK